MPIRPRRSGTVWSAVASRSKTPVFGEEDIIADLRAAGVKSGDGLFVHSALSKIGHVIGGPRGLIQALINAVGPEGLVCMPGFSGDAYDPVKVLKLDIEPGSRDGIRRQVPGFDLTRSNVLQNGTVAEAFRNWPAVVRSPHPTSSMLLFGHDAEDLSVPHDPYGWATGPETPWGRLRDRTNMKILLIGVGWNRCSALHAAESIADFKRTVVRRFKLGTGPDAPWIEAPDVEDDLDRLFPVVGAAWEKTGRVQSCKIGRAACKLTDYGQLVEFASRWISERNQSDLRNCRGPNV